MRKLFVFAICLLCSAQANAISILNYNELPTDLIHCYLSSDCVFSESTNLDTAGAAAFEYWQDNGTSVEHKWLMRYKLLSPPGTVSGVAWLTAQNSYDISSSDNHLFTLYFNSTPWGVQSPYIYSLNDADLADGSAYRRERSDYDPEGRPVYYTSGDLMPLQPIEYCFDLGCSGTHVVNLLHMSYVNGVFNFNPDDTRDLLFSASWYFPGTGGEAESLYTAPLPGSALLLLSGIVGGALSFRRKIISQTHNGKVS